MDHLRHWYPSPSTKRKNCKLSLSTEPAANRFDMILTARFQVNIQETVSKQCGMMSNKSKSWKVKTLFFLLTTLVATGLRADVPPTPPSNTGTRMQSQRMAEPPGLRQVQATDLFACFLSLVEGFVIGKHKTQDILPMLLSQVSGRKKTEKTNPKISQNMQIWRRKNKPSNILQININTSWVLIGDGPLPRYPGIHIWPTVFRGVDDLIKRTRGSHESIKTQESTWRPNMANENLSEFMQERPWESHPQTMHVTVSPCVNLESLGAHEVKIAKEDSSDMLIKIRRQSSWISQFHTTQQYPQIAGNLFQKKTDKCRNRWITNAFPTWKRRPYLQICTRRDCNII